MRKASNPIKIIGGWVLLVIIIDIFAIPYLYFNSVGGEQRPLTFLMSSIKIGMEGIFLLSILTAILYFGWFKKFWFLNCFFFLVSGIYIVKDINSSPQIQYGFKEVTDSIGGYEIKTRTEYYNLVRNEVRSRSYWKNGEKDSIWTTYSKEGNVLKQERYKNAKLIR
jgi:hypothetical protein